MIVFKKKQIVFNKNKQKIIIAFISICTKSIRTHSIIWDQSNGVPVNVAFICASANAEKTVFTPIFSPRISHMPVFCTIINAPSDNFHCVQSKRIVTKFVLVYTYNMDIWYKFHSPMYYYIGTKATKNLIIVLSYLICIT